MVSILNTMLHGALLLWKHMNVMFKGLRMSVLFDIVYAILLAIAKHFVCFYVKM